MIFIFYFQNIPLLKKIGVKMNMVALLYNIELSYSANTYMLLFFFTCIYFLIEMIASYASISHNVVYII